MKAILEITCQTIPARFQEPMIKKGTEIFAVNKYFRNTKANCSSEVFSIEFEIEKEIIIESQTVKGPKVDCDEQIINKFLEVNKAKKEELEQRNGIFYCFLPEKKIKADEYLVDFFPKFMKEMVGIFDNPLQLNKDHFPWIRRIKNVTINLDNKNIKLGFYGLKDRSFSINSYHKDLEKNNIIQDVEKRFTYFNSQITKVEKTKNIQCVSPESLKKEICGIYDYPHLGFAKIRDDFLSLPKELIRLIIESNQKYIIFENKDGSIFEYCGIASNFESINKTIISGHEVVINSRLSDGRFFYDIDKETEIEVFCDALKKINFIENLSVYDRIKSIKSKFTELFNEEPEGIIEFLKLDLASKCVIEFPELQGVIGGYYAKTWGLNDEDAKIIKEQYLNDFSSKRAAKILIADRLEYIESMFEHEKIPTSSKDPFAIRRKILTIIKGAIDFDLNIKMDFKDKRLAEFFINRFCVYVTKELKYDEEIIKNILKKHNNITEIIKIYVGVINDLQDEDLVKKTLLYKRVAKVLDKRFIRNFESEFLEAENDFELKMAEMINKNHLDIAIVDEFLNNCVVNCEKEKLKNQRLFFLTKIHEELKNKISDNIINFSIDC